ncbi:MAG: hypothetical protein ABI175_17440 [Polyangiales bacterium]
MRKLVGLSLLLVAACEPSTPEPTELAQGVTVLEATASRVSAAYRSGDLVIYLQSVQGKATPYQGDPKSPQFEIDARLVADNGRIFYIRRGGDSFIDPTWTADLDAQSALPPSRESNRVLFDMADEAGAALSDLSITEARTQIDTLIATARLAPGTFEMMVEQRAAAGLPEMKEIAYGSSNGPEASDVQLGANYYYMALHAADLDNSPWGYHSATRLYRWDGYWAGAVDFCNHGRCPLEMPQVGIVQTANSGLKPAFRIDACNTGYGLYSDNGGHNCHDDSRLEMAGYAYGNGHQKDPGNAYWCNGNDDSTDISVNIWGWETDQSGYPNTTTDSNRGYNNPQMCRTQNNHGYNGAAGCYCDSACVNYNDCCLDGPY